MTASTRINGHVTAEDLDALAMWTVTGTIDAERLSPLLRDVGRGLQHTPGDAPWDTLLANLSGALPDRATSIYRGIRGRLNLPAAETTDAPALPPRATATLKDLEGVLTATRWEWPGWLPIGYLTLLVGQPGVGKSAVALRLAASVLSYWPWPDGSMPDGEPAPVVWIDSEASQALLLERASAWGLPLDRILLPTTDPGNPLADVQLDTADGWAALQRLLSDHRPRLVVLDAWRGAQGTRENDSDEQGALLKRLASLARDEKIAFLVLHHLRKANQFENVDEVTLDRVRGSSTITQYARVVLAVDRPDPRDRDAGRLSVIKSNLARKPEPVGVTVDDRGVTFGLAPTPPRPRESELERAGDFLCDLLSRQPLPFNDVEQQIRAAGISTATLRRAKEDRGVLATKRADGWYWSLPARTGAE